MYSVDFSTEKEHDFVTTKSKAQPTMLSPSIITIFTIIMNLVPGLISDYDAKFECT